jgi:2'-5' RNA ligase
MTRLFVAVTPPPRVIAVVASAVAELRASQPGGDQAVRWVAPDRWHVTLAFLGSVNEALRPELERRLARVAGRHGPIEVTLGDAGRFGDRVLWVAAAGPGLAELARGVRRAAGRAGAAPADEDRRFRGHLTVGYARPHQRIGGALPRTLTGTLATALAGAPIGAPAAGPTGPARPAEPARPGEPGESGSAAARSWSAATLELLDSVGGVEPEYQRQAAWSLLGTRARPGARDRRPPRTG